MTVFYVDVMRSLRVPNVMERHTVAMVTAISVRERLFADFVR